MPAPRPLIVCLILVVLYPQGGGQAAAPPTRPRLDYNGDPLPRHAVARLGTTRLRHPGGASELAFSADGKTLASSGGGGVRFWRVADGRLMKYTEKLASVTRVGDTLVALRETDKGVFLHDVSAGKDVGRLPERGNNLSILSPDGKWGAICVHGAERSR